MEVRDIWRREKRQIDRLKERQIERKIESERESEREWNREIYIEKGKNIDRQRERKEKECQTYSEREEKRKREVIQKKRREGDKGVYNMNFIVLLNQDLGQSFGGKLCLSSH